MKDTAILIGPQNPPVEQLIRSLQADDVEVFWLQPGKEITSIPDPREPTLILLVVDETNPEEEYSQLCEWKKLFPLGYAMLLPLNSTENWEFGVTQTRKVMKIKQQPRQ